MMRREEEKEQEAREAVFSFRRARLKLKVFFGGRRLFWVITFFLDGGPPRDSAFSFRLRVD